MEYINKNLVKPRTIKAAVFDFDGTISTLRQGWENVMGPLMCEILNPDGVKIDEIKSLVERYIDESTGIQTIYQMQWLAEKVKEYGLNSEILDEWQYKEIYNGRLMKNIKDKVTDLNEGRLKPEELMINGSEQLLRLLCENGIDLYIASGTDNEDVVREVKALGLFHYFKGIAGAPYRKTECSKEAVIRDLIQNKGLESESLMVAGDGKVEIMLSKQAGALALGVASDEVNKCGINSVKREKLIKAGADVITGDFVNLDEFKELLGLKL